MNTYNFEVLLHNAIKKCKGEFVEAMTKDFQLLYPFATENINGYIHEFDLKEKSLLTVGSSGDQILNAILFDCKKITLIDVCPYSKFYIYLKLATMLELERQEFLKFLRYKDFPKVFKDNREVFNKDIFNRIKITLRLLDYESYLLWDELLQTINPIDVRKNLFYVFEEDRTEVVLGCNPYLSSDINYEETRKKLKNVEISLLHGNLFESKITNTFDRIWLSNIGTYFDTLQELKLLVDKMAPLLNQNGKLLICYLFNTKEDTKFEEDWSIVYNLEETLSILKKYHPTLLSFLGYDGIKFKDETIKDSILVYEKRKGINL